MADPQSEVDSNINRAQMKQQPTDPAAEAKAEVAATAAVPGREEAVRSSVAAMLSVLSNDGDLQQIHKHHASTLSILTNIRKQLTAANKASAEKYNACATDFLHATRLARQAKEDLNDITQRLANIKATLDAKQRE